MSIRPSSAFDGLACGTNHCQGMKMIILDICVKKPKKQNDTVEGVLKGYDQLLNLVLDEAIEYHRSAEDILTVTDETRPLGLVVCRGTAVMAVAPTAGAEVMASNPFLSATSAGETEAEGGAGAAAAEEAATA